MNEVITVSNDGKYWLCVCGNSTMSDGFDTCDITGKHTEPLDAVWTGLYACLKCGRVINQINLAVVSKTDDLSSFGVTPSQHKH